MTNAQPVIDDYAGMLLRALEQSDKPLSGIKLLSETALLKPLPKAARPPKPRLKQLLDELVAQRQVRSAREKSSVVYWTESRDAQACAAISRALAAGPQAQTALVKSSGCPAKLFSQVFKRLVSEGRVQQWPPLKGTTPLFGLQGPDPKLYLQTACAAPLKKLKEAISQTGKKLASSGLTEAQLVAAVYALLEAELPPSQPVAAATSLISDEAFSRLIPERMVALDAAAANGALVSVRELHRALRAEAADAEQFNRVVLQLYAQGVVELTRHDYPASLPEAERRELVTDPQGNYYNGIVLRR